MQVSVQNRRSFSLGNGVRVHCGKKGATFTFQKGALAVHYDPTTGKLIETYRLPGTPVRFQETRYIAQP